MTSRIGKSANPDFDPLVKSRGNPTATNNTRCKWLVPCLATTVTLTVVVFLFVAQGAEHSNPFKVLRKDCKAICASSAQQREGKFGGDLLNNNDVLKLVTAARDNAISVLKQEYGEKYYSEIFEEEQDGKNVLRKAIIPANSTSTEKFRRKLMMKLLTVQSELMAQESNFTGGCDCSASKKLGASRYRHLQNTDGATDAAPASIGDTFAKFIWTTGGHSAAAGHGNLYNESYTAFIEKTAKDVFASVGIEFIGKNYAMGGTSSAPGVSLCTEAIFGSDTDALSWDFGMTDGDRQVEKMFFYHHRASLIPSRPALFGFHVKFDHGWFLTENTDNYVFFENNGLAGFIFKPAAEEKMFDAVPDTLGLTAEQILALPPYVRNFKCEGKLENGDPYCDQEKYSNGICTERMYKASWHPGWKVMAIDGNAVALFLIEALVDAAKELGASSKDPRILLAELRAQEDADYEHFFKTTLPASALKLGEGNKIFEQLDASLFFKGPAICHTALLPAETRYLGYLTESEKKGMWDYDTGLARKDVESNPPAQKDTQPMRLAFDSDLRQQCPVPLTVDFKDYFLTVTADGWTTLTIPNDAEAKAYRYDSSKVQGVVIICLTGCDWGNCDEHEIREKHFLSGDAEMEVNGKAVTSLEPFDSCSLLNGEGGLKWKPNSEGKFVLRARVKAEKSFFRISTVVVL